MQFQSFSPSNHKFYSMVFKTTYQPLGNDFKYIEMFFSYCHTAIKITENFVR
jgi:hypothetical protein